MLSRPTTEQILLDCRAELLSTISRAITDPSAEIAIQMMENVLRNCAERAAHEIAWMHDEIADMIGFADEVASSPASTQGVSSALATYRAERSDSLHLDDVCATYSLASECLSHALEAALAAGDDDLHSRGRAVLDRRLAHEQEIMGEWTMVGRA
jgi:hypothetical protein